MYYDFRIFRKHSARIDDGDSGFEDDDWQISHQTETGVVENPLDPARFWGEAGVLNEDLLASGGRCVGIECNIWERARCRMNLRHTLCGGGKRGLGYAALRWEQIWGGQCGYLGEYRWAALLPRKTAVFLWEYNGHKFKNVLLSTHATELSVDRPGFLAK